MFGRKRSGQDRLFGKGDLKYVFLDLLKEKPRHGYDLIRELEERFAGQYTASPGTVYPVLQMLEDMGHVSVEQQDGRKTYTVTAAGLAFMDEREGQVKEIWQRARGFCGGGWAQDDWHEMMGELRDLGTLFARGGKLGRLDAERLGQIRGVLANARREIEAILARDGG
ncbi:MAG: transcriptional regulator, PadR family [Cyanobacteria bacterium RYN_339]|nr:transcriptional regulator, PadR family [Cyanobacteria bacterium RYN_339]